MLPLAPLFALVAALGAQAATKDEWRSRSIYQVITDRFAPSTAGASCDTRMYCGGTWRSMIDRLDYIQGLGFDAVWISPTGSGVEGVTKWGENYHGYWIVDPATPNSHFGTADDLRALSDAVHSRGMYLMVDVVPNHLASTTQDISDQALATKEGGRLIFKERSDYHEPCDIQWGNPESEQTCWLARDGVALMDLATERAPVADRLNDFIRNYSASGLFDGYRVDAVKHVSKQFQHEWCKTGGQFCIGEFYDRSTEAAAQLTRGDGIDSVFGFGMMYGAVGVFAEDRPMNHLTNYAREAATLYGDSTVVGSILDNHDLPRWGSLTTDKSKTYNALTLQFLFGGIPTLYYGFEADITFGQNDPDNRNPLWEYTDYSGSGETYGRIKRLNDIRSKLGQRGGFHEIVAETRASRDADVAFERNGLLIVLTKRGAGSTASWSISNTGFSANADLVDLLTCKTAKAGGDGSLSVTFDNGMPFAFVTADVAADTGICGDAPRDNAAGNSTTSTTVSSNTASATVTTSSNTGNNGNNGNNGGTTAGTGTGTVDSTSSSTGTGATSPTVSPEVSDSTNQDSSKQDKEEGAVGAPPKNNDWASDGGDGQQAGGPDPKGEKPEVDTDAVEQSQGFEQPDGGSGGEQGKPEDGFEKDASAAGEQGGTQDDDNGGNRGSEGVADQPAPEPATVVSGSAFNTSSTTSKLAMQESQAHSYQPATPLPTADNSNGNGNANKACKRSRNRRTVGE